MKYVSLDTAIKIVESLCEKKNKSTIIFCLQQSAQDFIPASPPKATIRDEEDWDWAVFH